MSDTVLVAGSYEVTPPWRTAGGVDRSLRGQHRKGCVSRILGQTPPAGSSCDADHRTEPTQPVRQGPIAGCIGWKRSDSQHAAVRIDRGCNVHIGVRVHTTEYSGYHRHSCPFLSLQAEGVAHATGTAERDPTEPVLTAQPASHRPTGACNTTLIIAYDTPCRKWAALIPRNSDWRSTFAEHAATGI